MSNAIPSGWQRRSLSALGEYENGFAFNDRHWSELGLPIVRIAQITGSQGIVDRYPGRLPDTFRIDTGDLIFSWSGTLAVVRWKGGPAWLNQHLFKVVPEAGIDESLLFHLLQASVAEMSKRTHGSTMKHIKRGELREFFVALPVDRDEQHKLAQILDTLDTAVHETEAIITKLKAVKQGLLHDLLTRGIDANGELRPPQAEAPQLYKHSPLGWVPQEWDVATLESVSETVTSGSRDWARFYADSGALFVRIGNLTREHINFRYESTMYVRPPRNADGQRTRLESGDILISITADLGIVGVVPDGLGEAYINQHIALVRPDRGFINSRFIGHYLAGPIAQIYISKLNDAGAKAGLNLPTIRSLVTAKPPRAEQDLIATRLDEIDNRIQNATAESAKLRKLKIGLMDDLLTGRVRVTDIANHSMDAGEEDSSTLLEMLCLALYQAHREATEEYRRELFGDTYLPELVVMKKDKVRVEIRSENVNHNEPHMHISHSGKFDASLSLRDFSKLAGDVDNKTLKKFLKQLMPHKKKLMKIWNELNEKNNSVAAEKLISELPF